MATEIERLDELLSAQEAAVADAFRRYIELVNSDAVTAMVVDALERRDVDRAFAILEPYIVQLGDVLPQIQLDVGQHTAAELQALIGNAAFAISFDASFPRAASLVQTQRLGLIREFSRSQFEAVEQAVRRGVDSGAGAQETARAFRDAIGLTARQEQAVASFRKLVIGDPREALTRALRDRRFDGQLLRAIDRNQPPTARQVDRMVERYRARALMARSETISRTEAHRTYSEAREESFEQMLEQTKIPEEAFERIWNRIKDQRTRDWHESMQGQTRARGEMFVDGHGNLLRHPGDPAAPAETIINCRCTLTFRIKRPELVRAA